MGYLGNTPTTQSFTAGTDYFNGTGSQTAFTLSRSVNSVNDIQVTVNNVVQQPNDAYTVSGTTLTMTSAPSSGTNNVYVRYLSTTTQTIAPSSGVALSAAIGTASSPSYSFAGDSNTGIFSPAADTIAFAEGGTEVARIDSSGNFGIGTSSPAGVVGAGRTLALYNTSNATLSVQAVDGGNDRNATLELLSSGNGGSTANIVFGDTDTTPGTPSPLRFLGRHSGSTTERMRITSGGDVLVGTTSSAQNTSGIKILGAGSGRGITYGASGTDAVDFAEFFRNTEGSLTRVGNIRTNGTSTTYTTSSDYRLKESVQPMTGALDKVALLKPCTYTWKATRETSQGFIAHELQAVIPEAVTGKKDEVDTEGNPVYQGIDTSFLVATLTAAIQELNEKVEAQAAEIAALKGANNAS